METLRVQVNKLEDENKKLAKCEAERRKLELEVNYWKEYVTNAQTLKRTGSNQNLEQDLADARRKIIHMQDELNECQKKLKHNTGKLLLQNKDVADLKEKLHEANSITAVYKAKIDLLHKELSQKDQVKSLTLSKDEILISTVPQNFLEVQNLVIVQCLVGQARTVDCTHSRRHNTYKINFFY